MDRQQCLKLLVLTLFKVFAYLKNSPLADAILNWDFNTMFACSLTCLTPALTILSGVVNGPMGAVLTLRATLNCHLTRGPVQ